MIKGKSIRVLIVDDDEDDYLLTSYNLKDIPGRNYDIQWATNYQNGLERIKQGEHDVYIIDYYLGANTGLSLIREALKIGCEQPMILLTGINNLEVDEAATELGAFDYLLKGKLNADGLERSIRYALAKASMIKAVKENEAKFRTVFEKSRDMIFITDEKGKLMTVSNSATTLTGFEVHELLQMNSKDLFADKKVAEHIVDTLAETGAVSGHKIELRTKNNDRRFCTLYATMQNDRYGIPYCQGVLHDLTAIIREERAVLLTEKMEATGRLMRMMAHEVRNPLTNINLALEGVADEVAAESHLNEYMEIIKRNAKRIDTLITRLLDSSKPTALKTVAASLNNALQEALEEAKDRLGLKKIEVQSVYTTENDTVMLDVEKVKIAFTNIIVNAIEAMVAGKGVLRVSTERVSQKLLVTIADNGFGILPAHLNRLFEPYFTSKTNGMGLGLAATLNIVQSHGGSVDVESEPGVGTVFYLMFEGGGGSATPGI